MTIYLYRYNSQHNQQTANFLLTQLKEEEFPEPYEDKLLRRKIRSVIHFLPVIQSLNIVMTGAIHRYYESRRRTFNDSQPRRAASVEENKRRTQKNGFQKRVIQSEYH